LIFTTFSVLEDVKKESQKESDPPVSELASESASESVSESVSESASEVASESPPAPLPEIPAHAQYLLIGAGTASHSAYQAIKAKDPKAKVNLSPNTDHIIK